MAGVVLAGLVPASSMPRDLPCRSPEAFEAERGGLRELLAAMAAERGFELHYWRADSPTVSLPSGTELARMHVVSALANTMVVYEPDAECARRWQVRAVWVLPAGSVDAAPRGRTAAPTAAPAPNAATLAWMHAHERRPVEAVGASAAER